MSSGGFPAVVGQPSGVVRRRSPGSETRRSEKNFRIRFNFRNFGASYLQNPMRTDPDITPELIEALRDPATRDAGFDLLAERCIRPLYRHARRIVAVHEDAEDVVQETFVRAYDRLHAVELMNRDVDYQIRETAESALDAVKNRLRLLGKTDAEIVAYEKNGTLSPETKIRAPIAGTIVQRKVGIGQYINASGDPQFVIGDLSTVWLIANVRESEIPKIRIGQEVEAKVAGFGNRIFKARVNYMAASLDPATRRLAVRSEVDNPDRVLRPEMFATYTIITGKGEPSPSVPLSAVVYEGGRTHVWVARPDGAVEARDVQLGLINADNAQVVTGLAAGEQIVNRGALFIDRAASGDKAS